MRFVNCTLESHGTAILDIMNEVIVNSTAIYDYKPRSPETMITWFRAKAAGRFPVIGVVDDADRLLGFASYGAFRDWPAYKYSVEHSVYVHKDHRGKSLGLRLVQRLIAVATERQHHVIVGGIDGHNEGSIALHRKLGFVHAGTIKHAGFKFGRWLDLAFYQLTLKTPVHPVDG